MYKSLCVLVSVCVWGVIVVCYCVWTYKWCLVYICVKIHTQRVCIFTNMSFKGISANKNANSFNLDLNLVHGIPFQFRCLLLYCSVLPVDLDNEEHCPVGWDCRIHRLHLCRGVRPPPL